jgi:hypothetical protein
MKHSFSHYLVPCALGVLLLAGCGGKGDGAADEEKSDLQKLTEAAENMATAAEEAGKSMTDDRKPEPPVPFKTLLTYLPQQVGGMKQENPRGETATMGEWTYSQASADYNESDGKSARVEIFDYAYIGMMYAPIRMWLKMKINRESTEGFERTTEIAGYPAYEKYENANAQGEVTVLVGDRFIVTVNTTKMSDSGPRDVAKSMALGNLAKEKGQPPA